VVLDEAVGPGLQGQSLQAFLNSTRSSVAKIEQVNLAARRGARSARKCRLAPLTRFVLCENVAERADDWDRSAAAAALRLDLESALSSSARSTLQIDYF
jgi:hypothetical protein